MSTLKNNEQKEKEIKIRPWTEKDKDDLVKLYPYKTNKELCVLLEKSEGQVRGMKERLGLNSKINLFTDKEKQEIEEFYKTNCLEMDLETFAQKLGRPKTSISRYAKSLNLTKSNRPLSKQVIEKREKSLSEYRETDEYINNLKKQQISLLTYYAQNKHPKGMLGKHHSKETCEKLSVSHIELFSNMSKEEKHRRAMKAVKTKRENGVIGTTNNAYSRCKGGIRQDLNQYFRSSWEANIARILNHLNIEWKYEYKRFNFSKEKEGILSYQPDFYLPKYNKWIEVKGWMDEKSKIRLELFKKYYPTESLNLILINEEIYLLLNKQYSKIVENWE